MNVGAIIYDSWSKGLVGLNERSKVKCIVVELSNYIVEIDHNEILSTCRRL